MYVFFPTNFTNLQHCILSLYLIFKFLRNMCDVKNLLILFYFVYILLKVVFVPIDILRNISKQSTEKICWFDKIVKIFFLCKNNISHLGSRKVYFVFFGSTRLKIVWMSYKESCVSLLYFYHKTFNLSVNSFKITSFVAKTLAILFFSSNFGLKN